MPQFKINVIEPIGRAKVPCILTAVYKNAGGYTKVEWFLLIPDDKDTMFGEVLDFNNQMDDQFEEEFLLESALMRATWRVRQYMIDEQLVPAGSPVFKVPAIHEDNVNLLVHDRLNRTCLAQLDKVIETTGCDSLREAIQRTLAYSAFRVRAL